MKGKICSINKIIVHCSESEFGNAQLIHDLHVGRDNDLIQQAWPSGTEAYRLNPFNTIGYHYVILNGFLQPGHYQPELDGLIEKGRDEYEEGAHCFGYNQDSLGVCLIGRKLFSARQLYLALPNLLSELSRKYTLSPADIYGHYQFSQVKSCPNIDIELIKGILKFWPFPIK